MGLGTIGDGFSGLTYSCPAQWIGPDTLDLGRHLGGSPGELASHSRRQVDHLNASAIETDLIQQLLDVFHSLPGV